jgi:hypothetical protein
MKNIYTMFLALLSLIGSAVFNPSFASAPCRDWAMISIEVIDNRDGQIFSLMKNGIRANRENLPMSNDSEFMQYVDKVSEHVLTSIRALPEYCTMRPSSSIDMVFAYTPLNRRMNRHFIIPAKRSKLSNDYTLDSPWANFSLGNGEDKKFQFYGLFNWNQRQLLADQAMLDEAKNLPPAEPLEGLALMDGVQDKKTFVGYCSDYRSVKYSGNTIYPTDAEKQKATAENIKKIPADILWLCKRVSDEALGGDEPIHRFQKKVISHYVDLNKSLLNEFFREGSSKKTQFSNINDITEIYNTKPYNI